MTYQIVHEILWYNKRLHIDLLSYIYICRFLDAGKFIKGVEIVREVHGDTFNVYDNILYFV